MWHATYAVIVHSMIAELALAMARYLDQQVGSIKIELVEGVTSG